jgi:NAD(P)H-flavin reductase
MCLLLTSIGRSSAWLQKFKTSYTEAITIHRTAGWWCVAHAVLHTSAFVIYYWFEGGWSYVFQKLVPVNIGARPNFSGMMNFYGALSVVGSLILAVFATPCVRRRMYGMFYSCHLITSMAFIVFGILHDYSILLYTLPACSYVIERVYARYGRLTSRAQLDALTPMLVKLTVGVNSPLALAHGTRWLYIKIPCIGREWHPFSITGTADSAVMHIKSAGDWSEKLCSLAQNNTEIDLLADGPYGLAEGPRPLCKAIATSMGCPLSDLPLRSLLIVAGGVGIVPFADLLDSRLGIWRSVAIIWAVRSENELEILERSLSLRAKASARVKVQVYITRPGKDAPLQLENEAPASQMEIGHNHSQKGQRFGSALKSDLVTGLAPGLVLYFTLKMYDVLFSWVRKQAWRDNIFIERFIAHGGILALTYAMVGVSAIFLALLVCVLWTASNRARCCLSEDTQLLQNDHTDAPLSDPQVVPCASQQFLINEGRPDIMSIVNQLAQETTTLSVHACGPTPLLDAVRASVSSAHAAGRKVTLQIEQAEW